MNIDDIPAGIDLDILLATHVMRWERIDAPLISRHFSVLSGAYDPARGQFVVDADQGVCVRVSEHRWDVWAPSQGDVPNAATWDVAMAMNIQGYDFRLHGNVECDPAYIAVFTRVPFDGGSDYPDNEAESDAAPLAIGQAALKAVGAGAIADD